LILKISMYNKGVITLNVAPRKSKNNWEFRIMMEKVRGPFIIRLGSPYCLVWFTSEHGETFVT
jgi:hypothetical protein